ncbi:MAG: ATPase, T2SS/T4P/T4SS family, partial [bacterium]
TLHTNNTVSSITRLSDIGLKPYLIASSLILIIAQRLVKLICTYCKEEYIPDKEVVDKFRFYIDKFNIKKFYRGKGCQKCNFTGFLDRSAVFEMLKIDEKIRKLISDEASEDSILKEIRNNKVSFLAESGMDKVAKGLTTLSEVARVAEIVEDIEVPQRVQEDSSKIRILIADDEEDILKMLDKRLSTGGYEVIKAKNGIELVEFAVKEKPDLIVTDVMMPGMDGFEATKILRSKLETAGIPIIMLTAKKDVESELKGFDFGADDYMTKPYEKDRLLARIKMLLKRRH